MANLVQEHLTTKGDEAKLRALIEDLLDELVQYHTGVYPKHPLALAVWFDKSPQSEQHSLLELFSGISRDEFVQTPVSLDWKTGSQDPAWQTRVSLNWKTGSQGPPFVMIHATSVEHFTRQFEADPQDPAISQYFVRPEVLYFKKDLLTEPIMRAFHVVTEPSGLIKGWYLSREEYAKSSTVGGLLASRNHMRPEVGLVKTEESPDFAYCRGLLHAERDQRWLPFTPGGVGMFTFYRDALGQNPGYFLFEGGSVYEIQKFEVKTTPEYSTKVLEKPRDDRYVEVYLRAVRPSAPAAA